METLFNNIANSTKKERLRFLSKIGIISPTSYESLYNVNDIIKNDIKATENISTQKTKVFHIIEFLKAIDNKELLEEYIKKTKDIIQSAFEKAKSNKTDKDDRYVNLKDLQEKFISLEPEKLSTTAFLKLSDNAKVSYINKLQSHTLLSLYIINPPLRNNFYNLKIVYKKSDAKEDGSTNYLIITTRVVYIFLQSFKNVKSIGSTSVELNNYCTNFIRLNVKLLQYMFNKKPETLFYHISRKKIEPLGESAVKNKIISTSETYFNIPLSINDYRHIWEIDIQNNSKYKNLTFLEKEKLHNKLLHSVSTGMQYNSI
jgi:hypothetical protein